jgi:hypothetical protein
MTVVCKMLVFLVKFSIAVFAVLSLAGLSIIWLLVQALDAKQN